MARWADGALQYAALPTRVQFSPAIVALQRVAAREEARAAAKRQREGEREWLDEVMPKATGRYCERGEKKRE